MQYLSATGVEPTRDVMTKALALVGEVLSRNDVIRHAQASEIFAEVMRAVPERFNLPEPLFPPASPALRRGSIHYGER